MSTAFSKSKRAKAKHGREKDTLLGLSALDFSGFCICQIYDKKTLVSSLAKQENLKSGNLS